MKKQIKEIANIMCRGCSHKCDDTSGCIVEDYAEAIYNEGYRKQIVAEWKAGNENGQYGYYCSNCKAGFTGENAEWIAKEHDFCPKCGAKMKGVQKHFSSENVRKMSDSDVRKNYQAILDSMREWK